MRGQPRVVAALGSSFAAGPGIEPLANVDAARSTRNYPRLLATGLGARLVDLTVSGATTATILDEEQVRPNGARFAPQIAGVPADAVLITITAGGNDLHFAGSMIAASWAVVDPDSVVLADLRARVPWPVAAPKDADLALAASGLARIVMRSREVAPSARVMLVDYVSVLGSATRPGIDVPFDAPTLAVLLEIQSAVRRAFELAAQRSGADLVRASELSGDHALGTDQPWVFGFIDDPLRTGMSFHPNEYAMSAVATAIADMLAG